MGDSPGIGPQLGFERQWSGCFVGWARVDERVQRVIAVDRKMLFVSMLGAIATTKYKTEEGSKMFWIVIRNSALS